MSRIPDLVRDSKLDTQFHSKYVCHSYLESGLTLQERAVTRKEYWKREKHIGGGSFGSVWLEKCIKGARDHDQRAVKEIPTSSPFNKKIDYNRELEAIAKFSHPKYVRCFVQSFGWYENALTLSIAMEYFPAGDLRQYVHRSPPLPEIEAQQVVYQLAEALAFLHENGFAHRDLKPENILIKSSPPEPWWVKVGDFGITKRMEDGAAVSSTLKGTIAFMAPELHGFLDPHLCFTNDPQAAARAADMWSLGEITFQILTKEPAFQNMGLLSAYVRKPELFPFHALENVHITDLGVDFVNSLMRTSPVHRLKVEEALAHPWIECCRTTSPKPHSIVSLFLSASEGDTTSLHEKSTHPEEPSGRWSTTSLDKENLAQPVQDVSDRRIITNRKEEVSIFPPQSSAVPGRIEQGLTGSSADATEQDSPVLRRGAKAELLSEEEQKESLTAAHRTRPTKRKPKSKHDGAEKPQKLDEAQSPHDSRSDQKQPEWRIRKAILDAPRRAGWRQIEIRLDIDSPFFPTTMPKFERRDRSFYSVLTSSPGNGGRTDVLSNKSYIYTTTAVGFALISNGFTLVSDGMAMSSPKWSVLRDLLIAIPDTKSRDLSPFKNAVVVIILKYMSITARQRFAQMGLPTVWPAQSSSLSNEASEFYSKTHHRQSFLANQVYTEDGTAVRARVYKYRIWRLWDEEGQSPVMLKSEVHLHVCECLDPQIGTGPLSTEDLKTWSVALMKDFYLEHTVFYDLDEEIPIISPESLYKQWIEEGFKPPDKSAASQIDANTTKSMDLRSWWKSFKRNS